MKGAMAANDLCGIQLRKRIREKILPVRFMWRAWCMRECFEGVAAREISKNVRPDYVVIGEASQLNLKIGTERKSRNRN